jgi:hypothetical protein
MPEELPMVSITGTISDFINVFLICSSVEFQLDALDTLEDSTSGLSSLSSFTSTLYPSSGSILGPFTMKNDLPYIYNMIYPIKTPVNFIWLVVSTHPSEKLWSEFVSWDD